MREKTWSWANNAHICWRTYFWPKNWSKSLSILSRNSSLEVVYDSCRYECHRGPRVDKQFLSGSAIAVVICLCIAPLVGCVLLRAAARWGLFFINYIFLIDWFLSKKSEETLFSRKGKRAAMLEVPIISRMRIMSSIYASDLLNSESPLHPSRLCGEMFI